MAALAGPPTITQNACVKVVQILDLLSAPAILIRLRSRPRRGRFFIRIFEQASGQRTSEQLVNGRLGRGLLALLTENLNHRLFSCKFWALGVRNLWEMLYRRCLSPPQENLIRIQPGVVGGSSYFIRIETGIGTRTLIFYPEY